MPIGPQPRGARGTIERPYSALRLRLGLAIGGVVICVGGGILLWHLGFAPLGIALFVIGAHGAGRHGGDQRAVESRWRTSAGATAAPCALTRDWRVSAMACPARARTSPSGPRRSAWPPP